MGVTIATILPSIIEILYKSRRYNGIFYHKGVSVTKAIALHQAIPETLTGLYQAKH